jgi:ATP citrate (pro-S)-lyase
LNKSIAYNSHSSRLYNTHTTSIMSAKSILEADGKAILNYHLTRAPVIKPTPLPAQATHNPPAKLATITFQDGDNIKGVLDAAEAQYPFLLQPNAKFVAKPDQLIKRRGKSGLLKLNATWQEARDWIEARANKVQKVEHVEGVLRNFLVEPFVPHPQETEYYININSVREVSTTLQTTCTRTQRLTDIQPRATGSSSTTKAA